MATKYKWRQETGATWIREDGLFIARFRWSNSYWFLLYKSRKEYENSGDYVSFKTLNLAKFAAKQ